VRTRHDRYLFRLWLARWGFALLVGVAIVAGCIAALVVTPPSEVPGIALQAGSVYRVEVGLVVFAALYVVTVALALALHNRGFTEIGTGGVKAQNLAAASRSEGLEDATMELVEEVVREVGDLRQWREESQGVR
jgi:hypothetical protein